jgi:hypothetical protein
VEDGKKAVGMDAKGKGLKTSSRKALNAEESSEI